MYNIAVTEAEHDSDFGLTKDAPYLHGVAIVRIGEKIDHVIMT